jgi:orotate phosphoribosyltransferase
MPVQRRYTGGTTVILDDIVSTHSVARQAADAFELNGARLHRRVIGRTLLKALVH